MQLAEVNQAHSVSSGLFARSVARMRRAQIFDVLAVAAATAGMVAGIAALFGG